MFKETYKIKIKGEFRFDKFVQFLSKHLDYVTMANIPKFNIVDNTYEVDISTSKEFFDGKVTDIQKDWLYEDNFSFKVDLLSKRYLVLAEFPFSPYLKDMVVDSREATHIEFERYPNIFQELEWWERRNNDEMPKGVSYFALGNKYEIHMKNWDMQNNVGHYGNMKQFFFRRGMDKLKPI